MLNRKHFDSILSGAGLYELRSPVDLTIKEEHELVERDSRVEQKFVSDESTHSNSNSTLFFGFFFSCFSLILSDTSNVRFCTNMPTIYIGYLRGIKVSKYVDVCRTSNIFIAKLLEKTFPHLLCGKIFIFPNVFR